MKGKKPDKADNAELVLNSDKYYANSSKIQEQLKNLEDYKKHLNNSLIRAKAKIESDITLDCKLLRIESIKTIKKHFDKLYKDYEFVYTLDSSIRDKLYYLLLNITSFVFKYCLEIKKSGYSYQATKYLSWIINIMESNTILSSIKFIKWRVKLYLELASCYEDISSYKACLKIINQCLLKLNNLRLVEEQQPLTEYINVALYSNMRYLKLFELKYSLLSGVLVIDSWKKKIDEIFPNPEDKYYRIVSMISSSHNMSWYNNELSHSGLKINFKSQITQYIFEFVKKDVENISRGLTEQFERKKKNKEKEQRIKDNFNNFQKIFEEYANLDQNTLKYSIFQESSKIFPIEIHYDLLKCCFDCKLYKEFEFLYEALVTRISLRQIECPFISEIDIQVSPIEYGNIPNKYEKIQLDLNINSYNEEIKKLRDEGKYNNDIEDKSSKLTTTNQSNQPNNAKNNDKNNKAKIDEKDILSKNEALSNFEKKYKKIDELNHMYVYFLLKRSSNPENAIVNFRIVFTNDYKIEKEIHEGERAICIPIKTYSNNAYDPNLKYSIKYVDGEYENNEYSKTIGSHKIKNSAIKVTSDNEKNLKNLVNNNEVYPYFIYKKTKSSLSNEEERLIAPVDFYPLISNSEFSDSTSLLKGFLNYKKYEVEITNKKINKQHYDFNHNYIYMLYKTDEKFYNIARESKILNDFYRLEQTYKGNFENLENQYFPYEDKRFKIPKTTSYIDPNKQSNYYNTKSPENFLGIFYNYEILIDLGNVIFDSIQGPLGNFFLLNKQNFISELLEIVFKKYLKDLFLRIEYFYERENEFVLIKQCEEISKFIVKISSSLIDLSLKLHFVWEKINPELIELFSFIVFSMRLGDMAERTERHMEGCSALKKSIDKINSIIEYYNTISNVSNKNCHPFRIFTCDNNKVVDLINHSLNKIPEIIKEKNAKRRKNFKSHMSIPQLKEDKFFEENFEYNLYEEDYEKRIIEFQKTLVSATYDKVKDSLVTFKPENNFNNAIKAFPIYLLGENEGMILGLISELNIKFFRLYLKIEAYNKGKNINSNLKNKNENNKQTVLTGKTNSEFSIFHKESGTNTPIYSLNSREENINKLRNDNYSTKQNKELKINRNNSFLEKAKIEDLLNMNISDAESNKGTQRHLHIPKRINDKLGIINSESSLKTKDSMKELKQSLQDAGKIDPDKPIYSKAEKDLLELVSQNYYLKPLLKTTFAVLRHNFQDQKYLLNDSIKDLNFAFENEENRKDYFKKYCFEIYSSQYYNSINEKDLSTVYPFSLLTKPLILDAIEKIPEPILIHKTLKTATFITPLVKTITNDEKKIAKLTSNTILFGQQSTGNNIVKMNCNKLKGTGKMQSSLKPHTVYDLKENEKYIFAYSGYDYDQNLINDIGKTSIEVESFNPLPLYLIASKIALAAYNLKHYGICKEASKKVFLEFAVSTNIKNYLVDNANNPLFTYKLNLSKLKMMSLIEQEAISNIFWVLAKSVLKIEEEEHRIFVDVFDDNYSNEKSNKKNSVIINKQKNILKNINIMCLALRISINIKNYSLIKNITCSIINTIVNSINGGIISNTCSPSSFLEFTSTQINQILLLCHIGLLSVPSELNDVEFRQIFAKTTYLLVISYSYNNNTFGECEIQKKIMMNTVLGQENRRVFYPFFYRIKKIVEDKNKNKTNVKKNKDGKEEVQPIVEEFKMIDMLLLKELERENIDLDEFLLSFNEFSEMMRNKLNQNLNSLEILCATYFDDPLEDSQTDNKNKNALKGNTIGSIELERIKKELNDGFIIWENFKQEGVKFALKYCSTNIKDQRYYEYCAKLLKRSLENNRHLMLINSQTGITENQNYLVDLSNLVNGISISDSDLMYIQNIINQYLVFQENDIVYLTKLRINTFLEKLNKNILEESNKAKNVDLESLNLNLEKIKKEIEEKYFKVHVTNEERVPYESLYNNDFYILKEKYFWIGELSLQSVYYYIMEYIYSTTKSSSFNNLIANSGNALIANINSYSFGFTSGNLNFNLNNFLNYKIMDFEKFAALSKEVIMLEEFLENSKQAEIKLSNTSNINNSNVKSNIGGKKDNKDVKDKQKNEKNEKNEKNDNSTTNDSIYEKILNDEFMFLLSNQKKYSAILEYKNFFPDENTSTPEGRINYSQYFKNDNKSYYTNNDKILNDRNKENNIFFLSKILDGFVNSNKSEKMVKILTNSAKSSMFLNETKSLKSIDNLVYSLNNLFKFEMISPFELSKKNMWSYLLIIMRNAVNRVLILKNGYEEDILNLNKIDRDKEIINLRLNDNKIDNKEALNPIVPKNINYGDTHLFSTKEKKLEEMYVERNVVHSSGKGLDPENLIDYIKSKINIDAFVEVSFILIQTLFYLKKYSLLSAYINDFNLSTHDNYAEYTLPYLIESQKCILANSSSHTESKKLQIGNRTKEYELWKNSRKKNKRQLMITGEIPIEQIEYERDMGILSKELFVLESLENLFTEDLKKSNELLTLVENNSNNAIKAFYNCKKLIEKYKCEVINFKMLSESKGITHYETQNCKKALTVFFDILVDSIKKTLVVLNKRQENYHVIQLLIDLGNVYYSKAFDYRDSYINDEKSNNILQNAYKRESDTLKYFYNAEMYYNETLDTIYKNLYSLKEYKIIFNIESSKNISLEENNNIKTNSKSVCEKYGLKEMIFSIIVLEKLATYIYDNDLNRKRECCNMAAEVGKHVLSYSLPNPSPHNSSNYSWFKLLNINLITNCFDIDSGLKPEILLESIVKLIEYLCDYGKYSDCLPLCSFGELLSLQICKSNFMLNKIRIKMILCCSNIGSLKEAIIIFYKIIKRIDTVENYVLNPTSIINNSNFSGFKNGKFADIPKEFIYNNTVYNNTQYNIDVINNLSKIYIDNELKNDLGCNLYSELIFSKANIYLKYIETENFNIYLNPSNLNNTGKDNKKDGSDNFSNLKQELILRIEKEMKEIIDSISLCDEINMIQLMQYKLFVINEENMKVSVEMLPKLKSLLISLKENQADVKNNTKSKVTDKSNVNLNANVQMTSSLENYPEWKILWELLDEKKKEILNSNKIGKEEQIRFYLNNLGITNNYGSVYNAIGMKKERSNMLNKCRYLISRLYLSQNLYLMSSKVLLKSFEHNYRLIKNIYYDDTTFNPTEYYQTEFNLNNIQLGGGNKKDNKSNAKPNPNTSNQTVDKNKKLNNTNVSNVEDNFNLNNSTQYIFNTIINFNKGSFSGLNISQDGFYTLLNMYILARNYLAMNRIQDLKFLLTEIEFLSEELHDLFFSLRNRELLIQYLMKEYKIEDSKKLYFEIMKMNGLGLVEFKSLRKQKIGTYYSYLKKFEKEFDAIEREKRKELIEAEEAKKFSSNNNDNDIVTKDDENKEDKNLDSDKTMNNTSINVFEIDFIVFSYNFVEYLLNNDNIQLSMSIMNDLRKKLWLIMNENGYYINPIKNSVEYILNEVESKNQFQINPLNYFKNNFIDKQLMQSIKEKESSLKELKGKNEKDNKNKQNVVSNINLYSGTSLKLDQKSLKHEIEGFLNNDSNRNYFNLRKNYLEEINPVTNEYVMKKLVTLKYSKLIIKAEILFIYAKLEHMKKNWDDSKEDKSNILNSLFKILSDVELIYEANQFPIYFHISFIYYLKSEIKRMLFIQSFNNFIKDKVLTIKNLKIEFFNKKNLIAITNYYCYYLNQYWHPLLCESLDFMQKSLNEFKNENIFTEFPCSLKNIISRLIDLNLLLSELRPNLKPKFVDVYGIVDKIQRIYKNGVYYDRENDDLLQFYDNVLKEYIDKRKIEESKSMEIKIDNNPKDNKNKSKDNKELKDNKKIDNAKKIDAPINSNSVKIIENLDDLELETKNYIKHITEREIISQNNYLLNAVYYIELEIKLKELEKYIKKLPDLANTSLTDQSKLPKDVFSSILESDFIQKSKYNDLLTQQLLNTQKSSLDSIDVLEYFKRLIDEVKFNTFDNSSLTFSSEDNIYMNLPKLYRFLKSNLSSFSSKFNIILGRPNEIIDPSISPIRLNHIYFYWIKDLSINYNLNVINYNHEKDKSNKEFSHLAYIIGPKNSIDSTSFFGKIPIFENDRKSINSSLVKLKNKFIKSLECEEKQKQRDEIYHEKEFKQYVKEFLINILKSCSYYEDTKKAEKNINIGLVPKVNLKLIENWIQITSFGGFYIEDERLAELFTDLHFKILVFKGEVV